MSFTCRSCGYSNLDGVEWCQNPSPQAGGKRCDAFLPHQAGWGQPDPPATAPSASQEATPAGRGPAPTAELSPVLVAATPGEGASCEVRVRNLSDVVDEFD